MKKIVNNFNNFIKKTIFKVENKTNNNFQISVFNKYVIAIISILFIYLFYLLIPLLYDKNWLQNKIIGKLSDEFNISLINSSDILYRILPKPHFLIKNSKITLTEIEIVKIFINQNNFFNKDNLDISEVVIQGANFSLLKDDFKKLTKNNKKRLSNKKIKIENSNIFFKDSLSEVTSIIKVSNATLFFDKKKSLNLFNLKGEVFNIPFTLDYNYAPNSNKSKRMEIVASDLRLKIIDENLNIGENLTRGINNISILNSTINTKYDIVNQIIILESSNSKMHNSRISYNGRLAINPFDLDLKINLDNYKVSNLFKSNSIINEIIKSQLLFNKNISIKTSANIRSKKIDEIFHQAEIKLNIVNGRINFDNSIFISDNIGLLEITNSDLFIKNGKLTLIASLSIDIKDTDRLFSFLNTSKKSRKDIKNVKISIIYDFLSNQIEFKNVKVDDNELSDKFLNLIGDFSDNNANNLMKSRRLLNELIQLYEG